MQPSYLKAYARDRLRARIEKAQSILDACTLCPRQCQVNRQAGELGVCRTGRYAQVSSSGPHFGEEDPLVGTSGSGTIFFARCSLLCVFCQNYEISHLGYGREVKPHQLARIMIELQAQGVHNLNFVTPSHVVAQILEALPEAIEKGLRIPLVYNSSGYDSVAALELLDGIVDIYLPDLKFSDPEVARAYCNAADYPEVAREAIREMHRQVGDLVLNEEGLAERGLLVRHLVMPENQAGTPELMKFLAREVSPHTYLNIMNQYRPCGEAAQYRKLRRPVTVEEYCDAIQAAKAEGLFRLDEPR